MKSSYSMSPVGSKSITDINSLNSFSCNFSPCYVQISLNFSILIFPDPFLSKYLNAWMSSSSLSCIWTCLVIISRNSVKSIVPFPLLYYWTASYTSCSRGFNPIALITVPISFDLIKPSPFLSKRTKNSLNFFNS